MSTSRARENTRGEDQHQAWEREIRHTRRITWLLATALAALGVRILISGATLASVLAVVVLVVLLLAALLLTRYGQKVEPNAIQKLHSARGPK